MTEFSTLLQQGNAWLFMPSAILLGALHGLEPGHSKTMMAAFIIAVRGTVTQAILLGLSTTISHTAVVWAIGMTGLYLGQNWYTDEMESHFQIASAILIIGVAMWMLWRTWKNQQLANNYNHDHPHDTAKIIHTEHGEIRLQIVEEAASARFRLYYENKDAPNWPVEETKVETERADGSRQNFTFTQRNSFIESEQEIPKPNEFIARLHIGHDHHYHDYDVEYVAHNHHHAIKDYEGLDISAPGYQDPHELAHANDIRRRFANREVTTGQIMIFGLTGGLIPCPAAITVLLICLQLKKIALGATLALCFSIGLALTMVASGMLAALSVRHVSKRWSGFGEFARKAPYFSSALILVVGLYIGYQGLRGMW
ncbi:MAG: high-affinity nickel-transporter [Gammaproteobacteria bacterium]|jgi:nickel/cobalt exporter|nr:high-affinity nickel-transporter [Gammaproteobacteria bacterium]